MSINIHDETARVGLMLACATRAVQTGFPHLPIRYIVQPPHGLFDGWLARQIAVRIVAVDMGIPRGQLGRLLNCNRVRVSLSVVAVNKRMKEPVFEAAYVRMARLAIDTYSHEFQKAAA